jgi:hypothetical protein
MFRREAALLVAPDWDGSPPPLGPPVVVTDWTAPWAVSTVVVTEPLGLSTTVVVVPPLLEPPPEAPDALELADGAVMPAVALAETAPLIAPMPLIL